MAIAIELLGMRETAEALEQTREGLEEASRASFTIGSPLPYAFGIETGYHRSGGLARRAGGAFYLKGASEQIQKIAGPEIATAIPYGKAAVAAAIKRLGDEALAEARSLVPVLTWALHDSIEVFGEERMMMVYGALRGRRTVFSAFGLQFGSRAARPQWLRSVRTGLRFGQRITKALG